MALGSVCSRQDTVSIGLIAHWHNDLPLHGLGVKAAGLDLYVGDLASWDTSSWSYDARRNPPLPGHDQPGPGRRFGHKSCQNCLPYAVQWRRAHLHGRAR